VPGEQFSFFYCIVRNVEGKKRGITSGLTERLVALNFADNVCLLTHTFKDIKNEVCDHK